MSAYQSKACFTIPPVKSDYQPKGSETTLAGMTTYEHGKHNDRVLICVYDIFGFKPLTKQGADALAELNYHVVMPDFFKGQAPTDEEFNGPNKQEIMGKLFAGPANFDLGVENIGKVVKELTDSGKTVVGAYGHCWGGKVTTVFGGKEGASGLKSVASLHPGRVVEDDFGKLKVPIAFFPSQGEDKDTCDRSFAQVQKIETIASKSVYNYYGTVHHGWAAARANLADEENMKQYIDVFNRLGQYAVFAQNRTA